ncbi:hypothetical protein ACN58J_004668, partial [Escherichia coli]
KLIPPNVTRKWITEGVAAWLSLKRMVNLTTRCSTGGEEYPRHTYRRAVSRIATTGSARSTKI